MSMSDALRSWGNKATGFESAHKNAAPSPDAPTVVDEMAMLVRLAGVKGEIDRHSSTWIAVCNWAATELLKTFANQERADDTKAAALRARARALRDLLELDERPQKVVMFADQSPLIP